MTIIMIISFGFFLLGIGSLCYVGIKLQACLLGTKDPQIYYTMAIIAVGLIWASIAGFVMAVAVKTFGII